GLVPKRRVRVLGARPSQVRKCSSAGSSRDPVLPAFFVFTTGFRVLPNGTKIAQASSNGRLRLDAAPALAGIGGSAAGGCARRDQLDGRDVQHLGDALGAPLGIRTWLECRRSQRCAGASPVAR